MLNPLLLNISGKFLLGIVKKFRIALKSKPCYIIMFYGSYATYEELKRSRRSVISSRSGGSYATYEELKLLNHYKNLNEKKMFLRYL